MFKILSYLITFSVIVTTCMINTMELRNRRAKKSTESTPPEQPIMVTQTQLEELIDQRIQERENHSQVVPGRYIFNNSDSQFFTARYQPNYPAPAEWGIATQPRPQPTNEELRQRELVEIKKKEKEEQEWNKKNCCIKCCIKFNKCLENCFDCDPCGCSIVISVVGSFLLLAASQYAQQLYFDYISETCPDYASRYSK